MKVTRLELDGRLDAEAHLLAQGASAQDRPEWSESLAGRVRGAAARIASRVDWEQEGITAETGVQWVHDRLITLTNLCIDEAALPETDRYPSRIREVAEAAASIWNRKDVTWIPEEVDRIIRHSLKEADRSAALQQARDLRHQWRTAAVAASTPAERARVKQWQNVAMSRAAAFEAEVEDALITEAEMRRFAAEEDRRNRIAAAELAKRERILAAEDAERQRVAADEEARRQRDEARRKQIASEMAAAEASRLEDERQQLAADARAAEENRLEAERQQRWLNRPAPAPGSQPFGVSHEGAELLCAAWMRHLGILDAEVTRFVGDGGIDVQSANFVAQVKNYAGTVAVADVRALFGVATADEKQAILFTSGGVTVDGLAFANRTGIALIRYDAVAGTLVGLNPVGTACVEYSFPEAMH